MKWHCLVVQSVEQIAFADVILVNKVDLVDNAAKHRVISRIKASTSALSSHLKTLFNVQGSYDPCSYENRFILVTLSYQAWSALFGPNQTLSARFHSHNDCNGSPQTPL
jgi:G3E family GTPase